jgi:hypothetical protein
MENFAVSYGATFSQILITSKPEQLSILVLCRSLEVKLNYLAIIIGLRKHIDFKSDEGHLKNA